MNPAGKFVAKWGEGPIWHEDTFYYVDIEGHKVIAFDPVTGGERVWDVGRRVGTVVPRTAGGLVIAGEGGFFFLDLAGGGLTPIADPEPAIPTNRLNDGKCDPAGRFWAGSMDMNSPRQPTGALYRLDSNLSLHRLFDGVTVSNGIVWNRAADTMFYIDTPRKQIEAFDYDNAGGNISNRRPVVDTRELRGVPDGMAIDEEDRLWVAMCHGGQVHCFDPRAAEPSRPVHTLDVPVVEPTAVAFGGPDLADLYITTGLPKGEAGDLDGRLFVARPGVRGVPAIAFGG